MQIKEVKTYKFSELSDAAKDKAIEQFNDTNVNYDWWESIYEDAANIGIKITGFDIDRGSYCKGDFTLSPLEVAATIVRDHGETCETYKTAQSFLQAATQDVQNTAPKDENGDYENSSTEDELVELEEEFIKSILEDYRIILQKEYEYQTSREVVIDSIEANEYDFTEDGKQFTL